MTYDPRTYRREEKKVNVYFVLAESGNDTRGTGVTRNVSAGGAYFELRHWREQRRIRRGDRIRLRLAGMRRDGRVVRVEYPSETAEGHPGIAVRFHGSPDAAPTKSRAG